MGHLNRRMSSQRIGESEFFKEQGEFSYSAYEHLAKYVDIDEETGCWNWLGSTNTKDGYGQITIDGNKTLAHRAVWMLYHNKRIPKGCHICHTCDNRRCVNPEHLFLGTPKDNMQDLSKKLKQSRGKTRNPDRFKKDEILEIRAASNRGLSFWKIADEHNITPSQVHEIVIREDWPWLQ